MTATGPKKKKKNNKIILKRKRKGEHFSPGDALCQSPSPFSSSFLQFLLPDLFFFFLTSLCRLFSFPTSVLSALYFSFTSSSSSLVFSSWYHPLFFCLSFSFSNFYSFSSLLEPVLPFSNRTNPPNPSQITTLLLLIPITSPLPLSASLLLSSFLLRRPSSICGSLVVGLCFLHASPSPAPFTGSSTGEIDLLETTSFPLSRGWAWGWAGWPCFLFSGFGFSGLEMDWFLEIWIKKLKIRSGFV